MIFGSKRCVKNWKGDLLRGKNILARKEWNVIRDFLLEKEFLSFLSFFRALKLRFDKREKDERLPLPILKKNSADEKFFTQTRWQPGEKKIVSWFGWSASTSFSNLFPAQLTELIYEVVCSEEFQCSSLLFFLPPFFFRVLCFHPLSQFKRGNSREKKTYSISLSLSPSAFQFVPYIAD